MRSLDSENIATENYLAKFENSLVKGIKKLKESRDGLSNQQLKTFIRFFCQKNASTLGLNEEQGQQVAQYFFKFAYENPQAIAKTWELLHELSKHSTDPEAANRIFSQLIENNHAGTTLLWRVIRGIVRGDLEVKAVAVNDQKVYHLATPEDSAERQQDKKRQESSASLKGQIEDSIVTKPLPDVGIDAVRMTPQDKALFFKIIHFMQSDTDALITSTAWKDAIGLYFKGITQHLLSTINILNVQGAKSDARKKRYRNFIMHVLDGYLKELIEYCKSMTWKHSEKNQFAADLLFEHYLLSNNLLVDGVKEPSHTIIEEKWQKLFEEMRTYIEDDATMWGMQAYNPKMDAKDDSPEIQQLPEEVSAAPVDHFAPQVTNELPPPPPPVETVERVRRVSSSSIEKTIMGLPAIQTVQKEPEAQEPDEWDEMLAPKDPQKPVDIASMSKTAAVAAIMQEEIDNFRKNPEAQSAQKKVERKQSAFSYPCITVVPGTAAEKDAVEPLRREIDSVFSEQAEAIKAQAPCEDFVEKLTLIAKNRISTSMLMTEFLSRLLAHYEGSKNLNFIEANNFYDNIAAALDSIGNGLSLPTQVTQNLGKGKITAQEDTKIPTSSRLKEIKCSIPSIDSGEFDDLKAFLLRKGLHKRFQDIEKDIDTQGIGALIKLHERSTLAFSLEEGFIAYYNEKEALNAEALKDIKKLTGNWLTKHFKFGRSKKVKEDMQEYLEKLEGAINASWDEALKPTFDQYGKIIFGSDLYVQKA